MSSVNVDSTASTPSPSELTDGPRRPILFLIDVEPDARKTHGDDSGGWKGSDDAVEHLDRLRDQFAEATGAAAQFNWFLRADPQIEATWGRADWVASACPRILRAINDNGDYCGIHPHLWRWNESRRWWFNDFDNAEWAAECLATSIEGFTRIFGRAPRACRFGDRWLSQNAVELMRESGISFDLTIEPGMPDVRVHDDPNAAGSLPDFRNAPREPYIPSSDDYLVIRETNGCTAPDGDELYMIPLTTSLPAWRLVRRPPYFMKASRSPNLALESSHVLPHLQSLLNTASSALVTVVLRSGDLADSRFRENFLRTTDGLARHPALSHCEFTNPAEALTRWQKQRH